MVRERVQEVVDFATSTSPYRDANQGWLTDDVYLQLGANEDQDSRAGKEFIDIFLFWEPIKNLVSILFLVFSLALVLVVTALSYSHGGFEISLKVPSISSEVYQITEPNVSEEKANDIGDEVTLETSKAIPNDVVTESQEEVVGSTQNFPEVGPKDLSETAGKLF